MELKVQPAAKCEELVRGCRWQCLSYVRRLVGVREPADFREMSVRSTPSSTHDTARTFGVAPVQAQYL